VAVIDSVESARQAINELIAKEGPTASLLHIFNSGDDEDLVTSDLEPEAEQEGSSGSPSRWQRSVWQVPHHLRRHQLETAKLGPTRQLGTTRRCHLLEEEDGEGFLPSDVCSSGREVGNLLLGKSKKRPRQQNSCCKLPLILRLQKGSPWRQLG